MLDILESTAKEIINIYKQFTTVRAVWFVSLRIYLPKNKTSDLVPILDRFVHSPLSHNLVISVARNDVLAAVEFQTCAGRVENLFAMFRSIWKLWV